MSDTRKITIIEQTTSVFEVPTAWLEERLPGPGGTPHNLEDLGDEPEIDAIAVELIDKHQPSEFSVTDREITVSESV